MAIFTAYTLKLVKEKAGRYDLERKVSSSTLAGEIMSQVFDMENLTQEIFVMLTLDAQNRVTGCFKIHQGSLSESIVNMRDVLQRAILQNAHSVIVGHNHPAGSLKPSGADREVTHKLKQAFELMEIKFLDHVIVGGDGGYYSFVEGGNL